MAKIRVYELAKELGVESKTIMGKLTELGEFVRSASSTIEPPVVRKLRDAYPASGDASEAAPQAAPKAAAKPAAAKAAPKSEDSAVKPAAKPAAKPSAKPTVEKPAAEKPAPAKPVAAKPAEAKSADAKPNSPKPAAKPGAPKPAPEKPANKPAASGDKNGARSSGPRPGNNPFATTQGMPRQGGPRPNGGNRNERNENAGARPGGPRPAGSGQGAPRPGGPRPGNNPFTDKQAQGRPERGPRQERGPRPDRGERTERPTTPRNPEATDTEARTGGPRPGGPRPGGPRPGGPRPNPGMMPGRPSAPRPGGGERGAGGGRPGGGRGGFGPNRGGQGAPAGAGQGAGQGNTGPNQGGFAGRPGGGGRPGPGGRGTTAGAFGRGGGKVKGRKSKRAKRQEFEQMQAPSLGGVSVPRGDGATVVRLRRGSSLSDFADKIDANPASLVTVLFHLGEMATATQSLDEDTFATLGVELGYVIEMVSAEDEDRELLGGFDIDLDAESAAEGDEDLAPRPPVVTVMGHVDHGKTRLLDAIRQSDVISGEAGGITQHIGAYQVKTEVDGRERALTFIDTPGHEAFTAMRARGAQVTDIAILVVAADDGVMPQTVEALNHAQAAGVPVVVAVNKVDKDAANPAKIRQQLTEYNLVAEEYGGDTMFVDVSAKQNMGIDALLEAVVLTADASLDLRANPNKDARGVAIEANLDKGRGAVATVLVESGTLNVGDSIVAGTAHGRVRAMFDEHGNTLKTAGPARPVMVLGLTSVPRAGDGFLVAPDDRTARQIAEKREAAERAALLAKRRKRISLEDFTQALEQGKVETLNLVLKGDVSGAVEALEDSLLKINVGDEVDLRIIHRGVGAITQNDVNLATVDNAIIIGFNVKPAERVSDLAEREGVDIRYYSVIYQALDDVEAALKGMLKPEYEEAQLGTAEIREIFRSSKFGNIAGSIVRSGTIRRNSKARVLRDGVAIAENLSIESLKRFKDDATEVREGFECGIGLGSFNDLQAGDIIETWEMREKPRA